MTKKTATATKPKKLRAKKEDLSIGKVSDIPNSQRCSVGGCKRDAYCEVILYDVYDYSPDCEVFFQQDITCPYICEKHLIENEKSIKGERKPRGGPVYKYTNQHGAQGFTIYRPLK